MKKSAAKTKTIAAGEFKAKCLQLMDDIQHKDLRLVITKRGKPVADLVKHRNPTPRFRSVIGRTPNIEIKGDIISPVWPEWTSTEWDWD